MKNLLEQEWEARTNNNGFTIFGAAGESVALVYYPSAAHARTIGEAEKMAEERARAISAIPDALRALMGDLEPFRDGLMHDRHCPIRSGLKCEDRCYAKRAALRKAGVI